MWWLAPLIAQAAPLQTDQEIRATGVDMDPDGAWSGYGILGGRWIAHAATHASIVGGDLGPVRWDLGLQGFVELVNFDEYPVPFQSFRAHVGFDSIWSSPAIDSALPEGGLVTARLGWFHESDHVADDDGFLEYRAGAVIDGDFVFADYDDNNVSSYEFLRLALSWRQPWGERWESNLVATPRIFTPDVNPYARRELTAGIAGEARVSVRLTERGALALGGRAERWWHDFDPDAVGLRSDLGRAPLVWQNAEVAWQLHHPEGRAWIWYIAHSNSSGRGADFFLEYGPEWGGGLRFVR
ncbi:MAG: hypothetical protein ACI8S6_001920 [Myxococcota bacterium]|jgi:hypothetical protein